MHFSQPDADILLRAPEGNAKTALRRVTHLCIAAHQDDIEIMAQEGIDACRAAPGELAFGGVVVTDGGGSSRRGPYAGHSDAQMRACRREEQRRAALEGGYAVMIQLAHPSAAVHAPRHAPLLSDLGAILSACRPRVLYVHNPADKHDTHVAVLLRCLEALRALPPEQRPARLLGCEVWRGLDWIDDTRKVALDSGRDPELARRLLACFDSQIAGGKRYDLAVEGRRRANATFHQSHAGDGLASITWAMDLTPLLDDQGPTVPDFVDAELARLRQDVLGRLARLGHA